MLLAVTCMRLRVAAIVLGDVVLGDAAAHDVGRSAVVEEVCERDQRGA